MGPIYAMLLEGILDNTIISITKDQFNQIIAETESRK
jgi:hypothetical protein